MADMRPIETAPRDGTPILIKLKDHIPLEYTQRWQGTSLVACSRESDGTLWSMAAPVGVGWLREEWIEGWWPLPPRSAGRKAGQICPGAKR